MADTDEHGSDADRGALPSASVVIPAYNAAGIIGRGLESLLAQSARPDEYEIIVVDDASRDDTAAVVESWIGRAAAAGVSLRVVRQPKNAGPASARNRGAAEATGEIVIFTDSDCEPTTDWLAQMLAPFDDPGVAAVKGAYLTRQTALGARFAQAEFVERYRMLEAADSVDVVFSYSAAFRRTVFEALGGFDLRFPVADNEDTEFSWRLVAAGHKAVFNPRALLYHRHPESLRDYYRKKVSRGYWRMIVYRKFPEKAVKDSYTPQSLKAQIVLAWGAAGLLVLSILWPALLWAVAALLVVFAATALPFARLAWESDRTVAVLSPVLLFGRALAMGWGIIKSLPRLLRPDPLAPRDA